MKYDLSNPVSLDKFNFRVAQLTEKGSFVELKKISTPRSNQQNKYLHVLLAYFASEYGELTDYIKDVMFKQTVNPELFKRTYTNKVTGVERVYWRSTSELDSAEMTQAIERFRDYASKEAGIYLPSPDNEEFLKHCEMEIARNPYH